MVNKYSYVIEKICKKDFYKYNPLNPAGIITQRAAMSRSAELKQQDNLFIHPWDDIARIGSHQRTLLASGEGVYVRDSDGNPVTDSYIWTCNENSCTWSTSCNRDGAFTIIGLDGFGKDVFTVNITGKTSNGESFRMEMPGVRLHADDLSFVVQ